MKLKQLKLQGYKTFASTTEFDFSASITAIVGPNGSGKSNVADAIRWVLGEQSYSALRGKRTTDMIFAGSQERARAGMAQATLTLDNSDGWLPIDYSEVEIGRRAFRSGENEYLINGQKVRLRDVQELLATSGLAERTYTIIGQGLIDQALSLRAEERRALFEEAAGINHYQARRAETLRRLEETQRNLERVNDILSEIRPRLGMLKRQSNRARNYEQIRADLHHLLRTWYGYQWQQKKEALREQRQLAKDAEAEWRESRDHIAAQHTAGEQERRQIARLQAQIEERGNALELLRERREQARRRVAVLTERQTLLRRQLADIDAEQPRLQQEQEVAREALDQAMTDLERAQQDLAQEEASLQRFNQGFQSQQVQIDQWTETVTRLEREQREEQQELAQAEGRLSQLKERLLETKEDGDEENLSEAASRLAGLQEEAAAAEAKHEELVLTGRIAREAVQKAQRALRQLQHEQQAQQRSVNRLSEEVARLEARRELLEQMRHQEVQVSESVATIGRVASRVRIPKEHARPIEAALGVRLTMLLLPDEASLWQLLRDNGQKEMLLAVALEHDNVQPFPLPDHPGVIARASDVVEVQREIAPVGRLLFDPIVLVKSRKSAYEVGRQLPSGMLAVAPDGFVVHSGGLVEIRPNDPQHSILAREAAWRTVQQELQTRQAALAQAQAVAEEQQEALDNAQKILQQSEAEQQRAERHIQEAAGYLAQAQRNLDRASHQYDIMLRQKQARAQTIARLQERVKQAASTIARHRSAISHLESRAAAARVRLEALPVAEAEQERRTRRQGREAARTIVAGREAVVESRRATLNQVETHLRRQEERRRALQREEDQLDLAGAQADLHKLREGMTAIEGELKPLTSRLEEKQARLEEQETEMGRLQRHTHSLETHYTQMKVTLSQRESELEGLMERIQTDLGLVDLEFDEERGGQTPLPFAEIVEQLPEVETLPADIAESIQRYRGQLHRLGAINLDAPAEYTQTKERYDFLTQQVEDLNRTEKRLRGVIADLDDLTSQAFAATVCKVDDFFGDMFSRLFAGGSARLVLTDPEDPITSGVDIVARLPNRRQQRLALLSGGERSLTAAALIFALLKVAPPPFCVLDEVDAMLDEANITRFREVLRELTADSQFIVITHSRGTVQVARTVYGVSMGTDSASQVISIRPEEYVNG